jgi:small subunit ribosomal protein S17
MARKRKIAEVVSNKMQKTLVVKIETKKPHPLYKKPVLKTRRMLVHCEENLPVGSKVLIEEGRKMSKEKSWRVVEVLAKGEE